MKKIHERLSLGVRMGTKVNIWRDYCLANGSTLIVIDFLSICAFCWAIYITSGVLLHPRITLENKWPFYLFLPFLIFVIGIHLIGIKDCLLTLKAAVLFSGRIAGICHYNKEFVIPFSEIQAITDTKLTFAMKPTRLFQDKEGGFKKKGFDIVMKNGKTYHVSPHMEDLESLKQVLLEGMECRTNNPNELGLHA